MPEGQARPPNNGHKNNKISKNRQKEKNKPDKGNNDFKCYS